MTDSLMRWMFANWSLSGASSDRESSRLARHRSSTLSDSGEVTPAETYESAHTAEQTSRLINGVLAGELLTRIQRGDRDAFSHLYMATRASLWRLATILTRSPESAEDIVQNVFLSVWLRRDQFSSNDDIQSYLRQAIRNASRQLSRHARVVQTYETTTQQQSDVADLSTDVVPHFDEQSDRNIFIAAYRNALTALNERQRTALQLRLEEEMTFESIGSIMGISKVAARKLVLAAELKVRELLTVFEP